MGFFQLNLMPKWNVKTAIKFIYEIEAETREQAEEQARTKTINDISEVDDTNLTVDIEEIEEVS